MCLNKHRYKHKYMLLTYAFVLGGQSLLIHSSLCVCVFLRNRT